MRTIDDQSLDNDQPYLTEMITAQRARRTVLKGAIAGLASLSALGTSALVKPGAVFAHSSRSQLQHILDIAVTLEQLAVTTYSNAVDSASALGLAGDDLKHLKTALIEEQIHELFFESLGAQPLTSTFSYSDSSSTFSDLSTFISTQQQLEELSASVYLVGIVEVAKLNQYRLAQILAQIAGIESEHRLLGRIISNADPANNYAYTPVLIKHIADVPGILSDEGYLSPTSDNTYAYQQVSTKGKHIEYRTPYVTNTNPGSTSSKGKGNKPQPSGPEGPSGPNTPVDSGGPGGPSAPAGPGGPGNTDNTGDSNNQTGTIGSYQPGTDDGPSGFEHKRPVRMGF